MATGSRANLIRTARARKVGVAQVFKDLLFLRSKMGVYLAWSFHSRIWEIILAGKSKKLIAEKANLAAAIEKHGEPSPEIITDLLGVRGGMPKTKDKLMLLALALGLESSGTVLELSQRCKEAMGRTYAERRAGVTPPGAGDGATTSSPSSSSVPDSSAQGVSLMVDLQKQVQALQSQLAQLKKESALKGQPVIPVSLVELPATQEENDDWAMDIGAGWSGENAVYR